MKKIEIIEGKEFYKVAAKIEVTGVAVVSGFIWLAKEDLPNEADVKSIEISGEDLQRILDRNIQNKS